MCAGKGANQAVGGTTQVTGLAGVSHHAALGSSISKAVLFGGTLSPWAGGQIKAWM